MISKKIGLISLVLLAFLLNACEQSVSSAPPTLVSAQASPPVDVNMDTIAIAASQTAAASTPATVVLEGTGTATPPGTLPLVTPDPSLPSPTPDGSVPVLPTDASVAPPVQPTVQTEKPTTYTLQQGEFIFCLARRFNVDPDETLRINGLWDSETIYPGLTVKIPVNTTFPATYGQRALTAHPATYTVTANDTIYSIACRYGDVDPISIANANGLAAPYDLTVGAQLNIP